MNNKQTLAHDLNTFLAISFRSKLASFLVISSCALQLVGVYTARDNRIKLLFTGSTALTATIGVLSGRNRHDSDVAWDEYSTQAYLNRQRNAVKMYTPDKNALDSDGAWDEEE